MNAVDLLSDDNKRYFWLAELVTQGEKDSISARKTFGDALVNGQQMSKTIKEQNRREKLLLK